MTIETETEDTGMLSAAIARSSVRIARLIRADGFEQPIAAAAPAIARVIFEALCTFPLSPVAIEKAQRRKAGEILDSACQFGVTEPAGQLIIDGFPPYDYEPDRMLRNGRGEIVENQNARAKMKVENALYEYRDHPDLFPRLQKEGEIHTAWTRDQLAAGRPQEELTWGACVKELGLLVDDVGV